MILFVINVLILIVMAVLIHQMDRRLFETKHFHFIQSTEGRISALQDVIDRKMSVPTDAETVFALVLGVSGLELAIGEKMELAPLQGTCGPFSVTGNGLPVFEYLVFEKEIMEFIRVRVEISKPDRIHFTSKIASNTPPFRDGEVVETKEAYKNPFKNLCGHLVNYFPLYVLPEKRMKGGISYGNVRQSNVKKSDEVANTEEKGSPAGAIHSPSAGSDGIHRQESADTRAG